MSSSANVSTSSASTRAALRPSIDGSSSDARIPAGATTGAPPRARAGVMIAALLLLLGSLPDSMVPAALHPIAVGQFGAAENTAFWFVSVNVIGALAAIPLLIWLRRVVAPVPLLIAAATANALLLGVLSTVTNYQAALAIRFLEGIVDLAVLAILLDLLAKSGGAATRGRRLGLGTTMLLLGLGLGALLGGRLGEQSGAIFVAGAAACALVAVGALLAAPLLRRAVVDCPAVAATSSLACARRPVWPIVCLMASDRALAGVVVVTIPMLLKSRLGFSGPEVGWVIAMPLLVMAFLAWPAGWLGDRVGNLQLRAVAGLGYALSLALLPIAATAGPVAATVVATIFGLSAAALMPTTISLAASTGRGAVAMAAVHAGGNIGYLIGIAGAGALLSLVGGLRPDAGAYALVVIVLAQAHVVVAGIATLNVRPRAITVSLPRVTRPTI